LVCCTLLEENEYSDKIEGCIIAGVIGDAFGSQYENIELPIM